MSCRERILTTETQIGYGRSSVHENPMAGIMDGIDLVQGLASSVHVIRYVVQMGRLLKREGF